MRILSIGEILWDVLPEGEFLGGAAVNFATHLHRLGATSALISGVGADARGRQAKDAIRTAGLVTDAIQVIDGFPTGTAYVDIDAAGVPSFVIARPAAYDKVSLGPRILDWVTSFDPNWLYFGTLLHTNPHVEEFTTAVVRQCPGIRRFYDVNLRQNEWNFALVQRLAALATVLKVNDSEAEILSREVSGKSQSLETFCRDWASRFNLQAVCVTLGADGCVVFSGGQFIRSAGYPVTVRDTVGSGDAFAAAFVYGYEQHWSIEDSARFANAAGAIVATRAGAAPNVTLDECFAMAASAS